MLADCSDVLNDDDDRQIFVLVKEQRVDCGLDAALVVDWMKPPVAITVYGQKLRVVTHTHTHTHVSCALLSVCVRAAWQCWDQTGAPLDAFLSLSLSLSLSLPLYVSSHCCQRGVMLSCRTVSKYDQTTARQWPNQADDNYCSSITLELDCCAKLNVIFKKNWRLRPPWRQQ